MVKDGDCNIDNGNLQLTNGAGSTAAAMNGKGNLIVGYNEDSPIPTSRTGSHNVIVGTQHEYTSYGGLVL